MSERLSRCPTCRAADVDQPHADRCKLLSETSAAAVAHGRNLDAPIHGAKSRDLWAHINTCVGDPAAARDIVAKVIDLGWRPVVGRYDTWKPAEPEGGAQ
jgi:hypothetical protein